MSNFNTFDNPIDVTIEKIVPNGYGMAFAEGLTIFVSLAATGDKLRVRVREKKGKVAFAEIIEVLVPSPERTTPECQYFGICGGCDFQQMTYEAQLASKISIIQDCLSRIGKINFEGDIPIIPSPNPYGYRSRAQWHTDTRAKKIGYFKRYSHNIVDVENCPILAEPLQKTLTNFRENLRWEQFWSNNVEIEAANADERVSIYSTEIIEPTQDISFEVGENWYFYNAESFFQGNQFLVEKLIELAVSDATGENALDLFCGVGLFTLPLARKFKKVYGVESNGKAIEFAQKNTDNARLANVELFTENVGEWLTENNPQDIDFVLLDPPRTGAERATIDALLKLKPTQISYVSCDPATLARDLRLLTVSYTIESITAIDLFPQTHHVETVVRLKIR